MQYKTNTNFKIDSAFTVSQIKRLSSILDNVGQAIFATVVLQPLVFPNTFDLIWFSFGLSILSIAWTASLLFAQNTYKYE